MSKMGNVYANKCKKETPLQGTILQEKQINQKPKPMTLEWNKITDKQPEWKQSVLAFNVLGNLIIIEYWRHDLKDTITHWINKPKQPVDKEVIGFTKNIDKKGRMVSY